MRWLVIGIECALILGAIGFVLNLIEFVQRT